jgi:hypothetical protein
MTFECVGLAKTVSQSVTRPADTTAYAAGDVIDLAAGAGLTFAAVARSANNTGYITDAILIDSANQATKASVECWLFNAALAVYDNDNAAFTPTDADLANLIGMLQFTTAFAGDATSGAGGNAVYMADRTYLPLVYQCAGGVDDLYGVLVVRNAYTPVSAGIFTVILKTDQN